MKEKGEHPGFLRPGTREGSPPPPPKVMGKEAPPCKILPTDRSTLIDLEDQEDRSRGQHFSTPAGPNENEEDVSAAKTTSRMSTVNGIPLMDVLKKKKQVEGTKTPTTRRKYQKSSRRPENLGIHEQEESKNC